MRTEFFDEVIREGGNDACERDASADQQHSQHAIPRCFAERIKVFQLHRKPPASATKDMLRCLLAARKRGNRRCGEIGFVLAGVSLRTLDLFTSLFTSARFVLSKQRR
jgi:hypothetical protein